MEYLPDGKGPFYGLLAGKVGSAKWKSHVWGAHGTVNNWLLNTENFKLAFICNKTSDSFEEICVNP